MPAVNGVAAFTGLSIDTLGSDYTLRATANSLTSGTTSAIDVTPPGVATQLVVTTQPPSSTDAGASFGLSVQAEDGLGNIDRAFDATVTVTNPADGAVLGQTTATNGSAAFAGLTLDQAGDGIVLSVTSNSLAVTTNSFTVNPLSAIELEIVGPTSNVLAGSPFDLDVLAVDPYDNLDPTFNGSVALSLSSNPGNSVLGGVHTATLVNGFADFHGLTLSNTGSEYKLQATAPGLSSGTSQPFNVTTDELVMTTQPPATVAAGSQFSFTVLAEGRSGNEDTSFNGDVTVSAVNSEGQSVTLGGTPEVSAINGVATFSDLNLPQPDYYILSVTGANIGGTDLVIDVGPSQAQPTVDRISPSVGSVKGGTEVTITGTNLGTASAAILDFGTGNMATIISDTGSTIVATAPPGTEATTVNVTVATSAGTSVTSTADQFTYEAPAALAAPVLAAIPAKSANIGQPFSLNVSSFASDPNTPALPLTYSLGTGARRVRALTRRPACSPGRRRRISRRGQPRSRSSSPTAVRRH